MCVLSKLYSLSDSNRKMTPPTQIPIQKTNQKPSQETNQESTSECAICYQENKDSCFTTKCNHTFCQDCMTKWLLTNHNCPMCRTNIVNTTTTKFTPRAQVNHVDDNDDEDMNVNAMEDPPFEMTIVQPGEFNVPETVMNSALLRAYNLTIVLNHDEDDNETIAPNLLTSWVIQKPPTSDGTRNDYGIFTSVLMHKGIQYAIYVETIGEDRQTNVQFLASSDIRYVYTHIVIISGYIRHPTQKVTYNKKIKQNLKQQRKQTKYRMHRNTAQRQQRYTHH